MHKSKNPNEITLTGSVRYLEPPHFLERNAGLLVIFWIEHGALRGTICFSLKLRKWDADIPPITINTSSLEPTKLRGYAREVILRYLKARSYVNREIRLRSPKGGGS